MTLTTFVAVLGTIGFFTGMMDFSKGIAKQHRNLSFFDELPMKVIMLFITTFGTIIVTTSYKHSNDSDKYAVKFIFNSCSLQIPHKPLVRD